MPWIGLRISWATSALNRAWEILIASSLSSIELSVVAMPTSSESASARSIRAAKSPAAIVAAVREMRASGSIIRERIHHIASAIGGIASATVQT